ncbi:MAG: GAF domain-containing protein, partial [Bacteroidetes bacterium]
MIQKTTADFIEKLNIAKSLYSKFDDEAEKKLSKEIIEIGMNEVYVIGNKVMMGVVGLHFLLTLLFGGIKNNTFLPFFVGFTLVFIFYVSVWKVPHHLFTRILAGIVLQGFGLIYLYQLDAMPEIRFLFFASFTFLIVYQDIKVLYPAAILFILQLLVLIFFANNITSILQNYPKYQYILNLVPRNSSNQLDILALVIYIGAVILQAMSIGLWATYLRRNSIGEILNKIKISDAQLALADANNDLENKVNEKTKELQKLLEITQADEEELRQNIEEIQATQEELESQRRKLLENQEVMLVTEKNLKEKQEVLQQQQWVENQLNEIDEIMRQNDEKEIRIFADNVLLEVAKIVNASRGAFYLFDDETQTLTMVGGYACTPETVEKNSFKVGEGIIGQVIKTKNSLLIDNIPDDGLVIESALAKIKNKAVKIIPLIYNGELQGVIELATLQKFEELSFIFLNQASKNIAGTIQNIRAFQKTQNLLLQSQEITTQLENSTKEL